MKLNTPPPPQETVINNVEQATGESNLPSTQPYRRLYMTIPVKFTIAILLAIAWTTLSVWLSKRWLIDLANITNWPFAIIAITFIAYVPGFMNAFLISTLAFDRRPPRKKLTEYPGVTILVAAYNEADAISDTLTSLSRQDYKGELEIFVLNDGSTDDTVAVANKALKALSIPANFHIQVMDYPVNAGKAAVLNRGLALASHDLVATIDGDSWIREDGITQIVERFVNDPPNTRAVAGAVMVRNSRHNFLTRAQEWDYFHGIAAVKRMQSMYHGTLVAQGAFSVYQRDALKSVGGWPECVGEDIVVSWALLKHGHRIGYAEDALAFTNVPTTVKQFALQRKRWSRGLIEAFKAYPSLLFKPRLTTLFIWWNLFFLPLDLVYTFIFIPGLILALFGHFWIAGPLTLAVLPLAALWNIFIFRIQRKMFHREGLKVRQNFGGFLFYAIAYSLLMQPVCVWGYVSEMVGMTKKWDTK
ncbi:glycosyltransferase [Brevundimonas sp. BH3]|uniref:glycosyltransferase n=1 Tax=Brevundimonas sp. BH3 TaxID=3133089 RepID=UPI003251FE4D